MPRRVLELPNFKSSFKLPISKGIKKGNHIYVSGLTSTNEDGEFVGQGDVYKQTQQVLKKVRAVIEEAGGGIDDIVKVNVYLKSVADFDAMNCAYAEFFEGIAPPARTTVGVTLGKEHFLVEIDAIAILE